MNEVELRRRQAWRAVFLAPNGELPDAQVTVIEDLLRITGALQSPTQFDNVGRVDADATLIAVGRQEVWKYVNQQLNLPDRETMRIAARSFTPTSET